MVLREEDLIRICLKRGGIVGYLSLIPLLYVRQKTVPHLGFCSEILYWKKMAVFGLHNVSVLDSSFGRDSQSPVSGQGTDDGRPSLRASSLLQMWREIEDENVINHAQDRERLQPQRSDASNADLSRLNVSESQGIEGRASFEAASMSENGSETWFQGQVESQNDQGSSNPRSEWLGESELGRVRIVREWIQMTAQPRGACTGTGAEQADGICAQIERVRDGLVVNNYEGQTEHVRRNIRRLCGRQALLDMIMISKRERERELQGLFELRSVSTFAYRNRIQSLLRGRFLRSERLIEQDSRSLAASELGILRRRHTVSGLREGFLCRSDNLSHDQGSNDHSDTSPYNDGNGYLSEETQADSLEVPEPSAHNMEERCIHALTDHMGDIGGSGTCHINSHGSTEIVFQESTTVVTNEQIEDEIGEDRARTRQESSANNWLEERSENDVEQVFVEEPHGLHEISDASNEDIINRLSDHPNDSESNNVGDINGQEFYSAAGLQEHIDHEETLSEWHEDGSRQSEGHWLEEPSSPEGVPVHGVNTYYLSDDDNVPNLELRELLSRRRVSNILHSGFRESLDQLIQSYVERQGRADVEWEVNSMPPSASAEQEQDQHLNDGQLATVERAPPVLSSPPALSSHPLWDPEFNHSSWSQHNLHQSLGIEWEVVSDLRVDMARLLQRLNNMQRMLEACMDMQLELQRSVRQEVSAALNRSGGSPEVSEDALLKDGSKWDHVRKGICCICSNSNIDSLLYRCGHMCTCAMCASELVHARGKCPMCQAPVAEVIRAYSI